METTSINVIWAEIRDNLENQKDRLLAEMRDYPTPIAGCDAQFNYLIEKRDRIFRELGQVESASRQNLSHTDASQLIDQFITASPFIDAETEQHIRTQLNETHV